MADRGIDQLVHGIINHPDFRECLYAAVTNNSQHETQASEEPGSSVVISSTNLSTTRSSSGASRPNTAQTSWPNTGNGPLQGTLDVSWRSRATHANANEELSSLFQRGSSSSQSRNPPCFVRGINHPRPVPYRRTQSASTSKGSVPSKNGNNKKVSGKQRFILKEVVLIPDPDEKAM